MASADVRSLVMIVLLFFLCVLLVPCSVRGCVKSLFRDMLLGVFFSLATNIIILGG